jgi:hypothetical protein
MSLAGLPEKVPHPSSTGPLNIAPHVSRRNAGISLADIPRDKPTPVV